MTTFEKEYCNQITQHDQALEIIDRASVHAGFVSRYEFFSRVKADAVPVVLAAVKLALAKGGYSGENDAY